MLNGPNEKKYNTLARKLFYCECEVSKNDFLIILLPENISTTPDKIQSTIEGLISVLLKLNTKKLSENQICEFLNAIGLNERQSKVIYDNIFLDCDNLKNTLINSNEKSLRFRELEWRLESKVARRLLLLESAPFITIKLHLDFERQNERKDRLFTESAILKTSKRIVVISLDLTNLSHLINVLEEAWLESKTHRMRNFTKAF